VRKIGHRDREKNLCPSRGFSLPTCDFAMSKRPPNELESRLHQAALSSSKKVRLLTWFFCQISDNFTGDNRKTSRVHHSRSQCQERCTQFLARSWAVQVSEGSEGEYFVQGGDQDRVSRVRYRGISLPFYMLTSWQHERPDR